MDILNSMDILDAMSFWTKFVSVWRSCNDRLSGSQVVFNSVNLGPSKYFFQTKIELEDGSYRPSSSCISLTKFQKWKQNKLQHHLKSYTFSKFLKGPGVPVL